MLYFCKKHILIHFHQSKCHFPICLICVCICVSPSAIPPDDSDVFCIIWSAQLHYPRKLNTLHASVVRSLLVTMDTAEAKVPCATITKNDSRVLRCCYSQTGVTKRKAANKPNTQKTVSFHGQESGPWLHMLNGWLCTTSIQLITSKGPASLALGKVTLPCLGWFISFSELLFIWPLTLEQFALGHPIMCFCHQQPRPQGQMDT